MWTKTIKVKFKGMDADVQIWLATENDESKPVVRIQSMVNEFFLMDEVTCENRDSAYDFIKHYPVSMANAFLLRTAYSEGAIN